VTIDVSQFLAVFYEESFEGLQNMEAGLLGMKPGNVEGDTLNSVFCAAHSIKGGGATFGFPEIAEFTHAMETLLDEIRAGTLEMTDESHSALLSSVDCLREMVLAKQSDARFDEQKVAAQQQRLQNLLSARYSDAEISLEDAIPTNSPERRNWKIAFRPAPEMLGHDPLRMLQELERLGEMRMVVKLSRPPKQLAIDAHNGCQPWILELARDTSHDALDE
jgi:two-component system chemotaxis sensor kinase CheA